MRCLNLLLTILRDVTLEGSIDPTVEIIVAKIARRLSLLLPEERLSI